MSHLFLNIVRFIRALRRLGVPVDPSQARAVVSALETIGLDRRDDVKAAARSVLVTRREHLEVFDRAFDLFWSESRAGNGGSDGAPDATELGKLVQRGVERPKPAPTLRSAGAERDGDGEMRHPDVMLPAEAEDEAPDAEAPDDGELPERTAIRAEYSARERLRHKDFARLTDEERRRVEALIARRPWRPPTRRARRKRPGGPHRHHLDLRRTWRRALRHGGEPISLAWRTRKVRPRPLIVLCDVSGSMEPYSRLLLQFVYAVGGADAPVEAFVFGTRLTRITRALEARDPDAALARVAEMVVDFDGGTRIGESLRSFNVDWGRRVLRRGAVVLVISDGWDRGDVELLEREIARLHRSCHRLLWLNPLLGSPGYEPLTPGIRAILRHVDDFLPVHDLASLEQLGEVLEDLTRRTRRVNLPSTAFQPEGESRPSTFDSLRERS